MCIKQFGDSLLVSSNSLPAYQSQSIVQIKIIVFSGTFSGDTIELLDHGYYTGELIYYTPEKRSVETENDDGTKIKFISNHLYLMKEMVEKVNIF